MIIEQAGDKIYSQQFKDLEIGEVFFLNGEVYLKVVGITYPGNNTKHLIANTINLTNNHMWLIKDDSIVMPLDAKLTIYWKKDCESTTKYHT